MSAIYLCWLPLFLLLYFQWQRRAQMLRHIINKQKHKKERMNMIELAKRFIGEDCLIYTVNSQVEGVIEEVTEGGILISNAGKNQDLINLDYVIRIRKYPLNKNGKRKSAVWD